MSQPRRNLLRFAAVLAMAGGAYGAKKLRQTLRVTKKACLWVPFLSSRACQENSVEISTLLKNIAEFTDGDPVFSRTDTRACIRWRGQTSDLGEPLILDKGTTNLIPVNVMMVRLFCEDEAAWGDVPSYKSTCGTKSCVRLGHIKDCTLALNSEARDNGKYKIIREMISRIMRCS